MMNIQEYQGEPIELYNAILEAKRGECVDILTRLRQRVTDRYGDYNKHKQNLAALRPDGKLTQQERAALNHCYDSPTKPLQLMKRAVLAALPPALGKCPYCGLGEIGFVDEGANSSECGWDHYLPRSSRPDPKQGYIEFAVHPSNLIPCCAICNSMKAEHFRNATQRCVIHVYHDTIDQSVPLLEASFVLEDTVSVRYEYARRPYSDFFSLFKRHCETLNLRRRYAAAARTEVVDIHERVQQYSRRLRLAAIAQELHEQANQDARKVGVSHWRPVLYRAAAASDAFLRYCLREMPVAAAGGPTQ
jgi:hypothetical protein